MFNRALIQLLILCFAFSGSVGATGNSGTSAGGKSLAPRVSLNQHGDFLILGNTMGWDCAAVGASPIVGTVGSCGSNVIDTSPDVLWRSNDAGGTAVADASITPELARTSAMLILPPGASISHVYIYWAGQLIGVANDQEILLERLDGTGWALTSEAVVADATWTTASDYYQCVADVTSYVQQNGGGVYRVSGLDAEMPESVDDELFFAAWSMVVIYEQLSAPLRHLEVWDGLDLVSTGSTCFVSMSGFEIPAVDFDAKLGVVGYEGDDYFVGDELRFGVAPLDASDNLSSAVNPPDNIFNGTRSDRGAPVSNNGDLPQMTGTVGTMCGIDIDVFDVTPQVGPSQTTADMEAVTRDDTYFVGVAVFSTSTLGSPSGVPEAIASQVELHSCTPNPFNPQTTIAFDRPRQTAVNLRVFDVSGRLVRVLVDGELYGQGRNEATWNGRDDDDTQVAAGVYFYRLDAGNYTETKRMALVK
jgi:clumping factor A